MIKINKLQRKALYRKWSQDSQGVSYREFRSTIQPGYSCIMVQWSGMWIGIELDGYTHS